MKSFPFISPVIKLRLAIMTAVVIMVGVVVMIVACATINVEL